MKIVTALAIPALTAALVIVSPGLDPELFKPDAQPVTQVSGSSSVSSVDPQPAQNFFAALLPACPSDGITENEPTVCYYDATGDNMSGKSFIAYNGQVVAIFAP